jgi:2-polyprenyl-6-methoxyphenol hydroxylase-like FAD-dependent oxidoreductase
VIIVGAGPAGLSAALILGRCRRRVLVFDSGRPRNARASELHGFLSRDGLPPMQLRSIARAQLRKYKTVELRRVEVSGVRPAGKGFEVTAKGRRLRARFVLLATGVVDHVPDPGREHAARRRRVPLDRPAPARPAGPAALLRVHAQGRAEDDALPDDQPPRARIARAAAGAARGRPAARGAAAD